VEREVVVLLDSRVPMRWMIKPIAQLGYCLIGNCAIYLYEFEPQWVDIRRIDDVVIHQHGAFEIDGFEQRIAETFVQAGIHHEVGVQVGIPQNVTFFAINDFAAAADLVCHESASR
jgi:hypothetical protein